MLQGFVAHNVTAREPCSSDESAEFGKDALGYVGWCYAYPGRFPRLPIQTFDLVG
jgi:hypothetical protein